MNSPLKTVVAILTLTASNQLAAMQINDPHSAAVFIQKQRPAVEACLQVAQRNRSLTNIWSSAPCEKLLTQDKQLKKAWALLLPDGSVAGLSELPYELRKLTIDAYSDYKAFAERIAQLSS
ncbi:MAG: hypothetical protein V7731_09480 [Amphritea sp.]